MNYNVFCEAVRKEIATNEKWNVAKNEYRYFPKGCKAENQFERMLIDEVNLKYAQKKEELSLGDFIAITGKEGICLLHLGYLYDEYNKGGWKSVLEIIDENIVLYNKVKAFDLKQVVENYDLIEDRLIIRAINYLQNKKELKECIYKTIGDIALVLYLIVNESEHELNTLKVNKIMLDKWKISEEDAWNVGLSNSNKKYPARIFFDVWEARNASYEKGEFLTGVLQSVGKIDIPLLTTATKQINGAVAMFYPGVQERLAEMCGGDYYVVFAGTDCVRIHQKNKLWDPKKILEGLLDSNQFFPDITLSNILFIYDSKRKVLEPLNL